MPGPSNPRALTPNMDPELARSGCAGGGLVDDLARTVDQMRQLAVDSGLRPYRVFSVVLRWTGGETGRGEAVVESETELVPRPLVVDMGNVRREARRAGREEAGSVMLKEISPRYTEDEVNGLFHVARQLPRDRDAFIEIRMDGRDGPSTDRRRFAVRGAPHRDAERHQWVARLVKVLGDRRRGGQVAENVKSPTAVRMARMGAK